MPPRRKMRRDSWRPAVHRWPEGRARGRTVRMTGPTGSAEGAATGCLVDRRCGPIFSGTTSKTADWRLMLADAPDCSGRHRYSSSTRKWPSSKAAFIEYRFTLPPGLWRQQLPCGAEHPASWQDHTPVSTPAVQPGSLSYPQASWDSANPSENRLHVAPSCGPDRDSSPIQSR